MKYVDLGSVLQPGQEYVAEAASNLGLEVRAVQHDVATSTCHEKADILGWPSDRVVKAMFYRRDHEEHGNELYGFVFPELGTRETPQKVFPGQVIPRFVGKRKGDNYHNGHIPYGVETGTCTPFLLEDSFEEWGVESMSGADFAKMFVHDMPALDNTVVDISIGGKCDAHKVSLHLPYKGIYDILSAKFPGKVQKVQLF